MNIEANKAIVRKGSGLDRKDGVGQPSDQNKNSVESDPSQEIHYPQSDDRRWFFLTEGARRTAIKQT